VLKTNYTLYKCSFLEQKFSNRFILYTSLFFQNLITQKLSSYFQYNTFLIVKSLEIVRESNCPPLETKSIFTCKNPLCDSSMISCFIQFGWIKADGMQIVQPLWRKNWNVCARGPQSECPSAVCSAHSSLRALLKIIRPRPASCQIHLPPLSSSRSCPLFCFLWTCHSLTH